MAKTQAAEAVNETPKVADPVTEERAEGELVPIRALIARAKQAPPSEATHRLVDAVDQLLDRVEALEGGGDTSASTGVTARRSRTARKATAAKKGGAR